MRYSQLGPKRVGEQVLQHQIGRGANAGESGKGPSIRQATITASCGVCNSYWRMEERNGGVTVECEAMSPPAASRGC